MLLKKKILKNWLQKKNFFLNFFFLSVSFKATGGKKNWTERMIIWLFSLFLPFSHQITCTEGREYQNVCCSIEDLNIAITRGDYTGDVFIPTEIDLGFLGNMGIQIIKSNAFTGTTILSVSLPEELRTIQDGAFSNCPNLHTVTFRAPSRDIMIGASAF